MPTIWLYTILSVTVVSLISLIGVVILSVRTQKLSGIILTLVAFSAGALLGDTFIHLLPEMVKYGWTMTTSLMVIVGILIFFILEKYIRWQHCHDISCSEHHPRHLATMNFVGDGLHNLIDGMIIAASFLVSIPLGIATTLAVVAHEIPQEIGDFGVLIHAGLKIKKALLLNFLSALFAIIGAIIVLLLSSSFPALSLTLTRILIPLAAGGFIYIAASDLIPELHKETKPGKSFLHILALLVGIIIMILLLKLG